MTPKNFLGIIAKKSDNLQNYCAIFNKFLHHLHAIAFFQNTV